MFSKYIDTDGYFNVLVQVKPPYGGSCPFLYTWDGDKFSFVSDMYGHGILKTSQYGINPEDYIKIEEEQLQQLNGIYSMQIVQEFDEISYIDYLSLMIANLNL